MSQKAGESALRSGTYHNRPAGGDLAGSQKVSGRVWCDPRRGKEESFVKQPYPCRGCRMKFVTGGNICIAYYDYVSSGGMRLPHCSADMRRDVIQILKERKESHEAV